ncbi:hypothetical protein BU23DRAFT_651674 [Bimuria novae-zelandiae CBS 107.79]|uniref:Uncharacterized protein n=1 Tax=Bimuria novae-zelandiae CBS 107.79 TaxID=1447943 RepID=A0A6A5UXG8_9PLEO|nr:hypothetical protein BU23DRAFT_651674 [Bimuria novae-zelandiae CBS 107.79]
MLYKSIGWGYEPSFLFQTLRGRSALACLVKSIVLRYDPGESIIETCATRQLPSTDSDDDHDIITTEVSNDRIFGLILQLLSQLATLTIEIRWGWEIPVDRLVAILGHSFASSRPDYNAKLCRVATFKNLKTLVFLPEEGEFPWSLCFLPGLKHIHLGRCFNLISAQGKYSALKNFLGRFPGLKSIDISIETEDLTPGDDESDYGDCAVLLHRLQNQHQTLDLLKINVHPNSNLNRDWFFKLILPVVLLLQIPRNSTCDWLAEFAYQRTKRHDFINLQEVGLMCHRNYGVGYEQIRYYPSRRAKLGLLLNQGVIINIDSMNRFLEWDDDNYDPMASIFYKSYRRSILAMKVIHKKDLGRLHGAYRAYLRS